MSKKESHNLTEGGGGLLLDLKRTLSEKKKGEGPITQARKDFSFG